MIANVVTLGVVLFLIFVFFEAAGDNAVFFIVINALILAAAVGLARCHEIRQIMAIRETFDYSLWSEFAGLAFGSVVIIFSVLLSLFVMLGYGAYDC